MPYFEEVPELCAASAIKNYLNLTKNLRGNNSSLFLGTKKPHKPVGSQTISRWLKLTLKDCGIDTDKFSGHSFRHASTSKAFDKGLDVDAIRKVAGWSEKSQVFAKFYHRPIFDKNNFALKVLDN